MQIHLFTRRLPRLLITLAVLALCAGCAGAEAAGEPRTQQLTTARSASTDAPPALPSSFYGYVAGATVGQVLAATVDGVVVAEATLGEEADRVFYALNVPADDPATPAVEGGRPGGAVAFLVDGRAVAQTAPWLAGGNAALDLTTAAP